jgi:hypothetical protein
MFVLMFRLLTVCATTITQPVGGVNNFFQKFLGRQKAGEAARKWLRMSEISRVRRIPWIVRASFCEKFFGQNLVSPVLGTAECGVRSAECGVRSAEGGVRKAQCGRRSAEGGRTGIQRDAAPTGLGVLLVGRVLQRWRAYGAQVVGANGLRMTEMARLRRSGCGGNGLGIAEISPLRGLGCFWWGGFYRDGAPTALGLWGKRVEDDRDGAPTALGVFLVGRVLQRFRP